jgi:DNA-binding NtrC family response regulator
MTNDASNTVRSERTVIFVSLKADSTIIEGLIAEGWQVVQARTPQQLNRALENGAIRVGVLALPDDCTERQLSELESIISPTRAAWIAVIHSESAWPSFIRRFVLDYCLDFVTQPFIDGRLSAVIAHAYGPAVPESNEATPAVSACCGMIGNSEPMLQIYRGVEKCAATNAPIFIAGESGTGKELTARAIHEQSSRSGRAFIAINCAAIPPSLLQSELFGHERGAFTGALQRKIGRIEAATGGTLFLDEIGDMPPQCQAVLLRFLQEGTIERLGGNASIKVDVRILSATHVDLQEAIIAGRFREDLFHRLCVLRLDEPPLRERGDDIKLLAYHALETYKRDSRRKIRGFSSDAITAMFHYSWPGNVRELINCVRRAVVMAEGRFITAGDLGLPGMETKPGRTLAEIRSEAESAAVRAALVRHAYNMPAAAAELGVSRATFYRLLNSIGLRSVPPMIGQFDGVSGEDDMAESGQKKVA